MALSVSGARRCLPMGELKTRERETSAPITSKYGFSVVAPIRSLCRSQTSPAGILLGFIPAMHLVHKQDGGVYGKLAALDCLVYDHP